MVLFGNIKRRLLNQIRAFVNISIKGNPLKNTVVDAELRVPGFYTCSHRAISALPIKSSIFSRDMICLQIKSINTHNL